jgi:hypothetical protein
MMLFRIIFEVVIYASAVTLISTSIADGSFWIHAGICFAFMVLAGVGGLKRNEDRMQPGFGQRRYFMTFGHGTMWAFFVGLIVMYF